MVAGRVGYQTLPKTRLSRAMSQRVERPHAKASGTGHAQKASPPDRCRTFRTASMGRPGPVGDSGAARRGGQPPDPLKKRSANGDATSSSHVHPTLHSRTNLGPREPIHEVACRRRL